MQSVPKPPASSGDAAPDTPPSSPLAQLALDALVNLQNATGMLYAREAERLASVHGVGDPRTLRVMQTAQGAQAALNVIREVRAAEAGERPIDEIVKEQQEKQRETAPPPPPKPPKREPKPARPAVTFTLRGQVMRADGKPAFGVLVRVFDKDVRYDDLLGAALTNRKGEFTVSYRTQDFAENETMADLYFAVVNASDKALLEVAQDVKFNENYEGEVQLIIGGDDDEG